MYEKINNEFAEDLSTWAATVCHEKGRCNIETYAKAIIERLRELAKCSSHLKSLECEKETDTKGLFTIIEAYNTKYKLFTSSQLSFASECTLALILIISAILLRIEKEYEAHYVTMVLDAYMKVMYPFEEVKEAFEKLNNELSLISVGEYLDILGYDRGEYRLRSLLHMLLFTLRIFSPANIKKCIKKINHNKSTVVLFEYELSKLQEIASPIVGETAPIRSIIRLFLHDPEANVPVYFQKVEDVYISKLERYT